jgi:hypothetical protein
MDEWWAMITLSCSGAGTINMRNPDLGNKDSYNRTRISSKTRNNELLIGGPDYWPKDLTITIQISTMISNEVNVLIDFLRKSLGKQITYTDHEFNTFTGYITTPSPDIKCERDLCSYSTSLEMIIPIS